ncbi:tetratricopeptide repeat protein [Tepidibacillus sp. LV47]|uniref:tetratricopeptide repeat protein n=1 Tax=Tepidibacillus sp. LV47 TaxID=3398228 RepID=UPI003AAAB99F
MDKRNRMTAKQKNNVIPMAFDADFFFERAMHYHEQHNYTKALKYLWKSVEYDSTNPIHYCYIAEILAEMGRFEESTQLLLYVVEKLDPNLTECYFYLASNYTYLDDLESSYHYVKYYLEIDPNGEYVDEAKEMLEYLTYELELSNEQRENDNLQLLIWHRQAKRAIEEGKYYEAIKLLLKILEVNPDFIIARNNLSLAYFYMGNVNKAIEQAELVLEREQTNIHALANLAIYYYHLQDKKQYENYLTILKKVVPIHREGMYKLATTFGILGEDEFSFKYLKKMIKDGIGDWLIFHYGAIAALNTKRYDIAEKWWKQLLLQQPSKVAEFYLELLSWLEKEPKVKLPKFPYHHQLPFHDWMDRIEADPEQYFSQPFLSFSLLKGLKYGDEETKERVIAILRFVDEKQGEEILRQILIDEEQSFSLKKRVLFILEDLDAKPPYLLKKNQKVMEYGRLTPDKKHWKDSWIKVLAIIEKEMMGRYSFFEILDAKKLWHVFLANTIPNTPQIRKAEGWAAALEYIISHFRDHPIPIERLEVFYLVSKHTIMKNVKRIQEVLTSAYFSDDHQFN